VVFFGISSTLIDAHTLPGQTEGLKGWAEEWVDGLAEGWVGSEMGGWLGGFAKVDNRLKPEGFIKTKTLG
jgi:hypothetical protein